MLPLLDYSILSLLCLVLHVEVIPCVTSFLCHIPRGTTQPCINASCKRHTNRKKLEKWWVYSHHVWISSFHFVVDGGGDALWCSPLRCLVPVPSNIWNGFVILGLVTTTISCPRTWRPCWWWCCLWILLSYSRPFESGDLGWVHLIYSSVLCIGTILLALRYRPTVTFRPKYPNH